MVSQAITDSLLVGTVALGFFLGGIAAIRGRKMHGLREANLTTDGDEPTGGEAFGARIAGGLLAALGLFLGYMAVAGLLDDRVVAGAVGIVALWVGLVTIHDWDLPGLRGFVATTGDGGHVAESARLGARIAGLVLTTLGVAFLVDALGGLLR